MNKTDVDELEALVAEGAANAMFEYARRAPKVRAQELRRQYESSRTNPTPYHSVPPYWYLWATAEMPPQLLSELTHCLKRLLPQQDDSGKVKFLPGLRFGPVVHPSVDAIACRLVRGAALKSASQSVARFRSWLDGEPMRYSQVLVLSGLRVDQTLVVRDGVRLERLPDDPMQLLQVLPRLISERVWGDPQKDDLPGATTLVIDHEIEPVFPLGSEPIADKWPFDVASSSLESEQWDDLLLALSLSCDVPVARTYTWATADELSSTLVGQDVSNGFGYAPSLPIRSTYVATQADAERADSLLAKIVHHKDLQVPITRWVKSKLGSVSDRLIDMRIVLESLYGVEGGSGEFTFRVATTGAWHLGSSVEDRVEYHDAFYELYRKASAVIHGRMVGNEDNELVGLLEKCSSAARLGILRLLDEGSRDWKRVRLGGKD